MGVQVLYFPIQDQQTVKKKKIFTLTNISNNVIKTLALLHVSSLSRGVHSPTFAHGQPSMLGLTENHFHGHTNTMHPNSGPKKARIYLHLWKISDILLRLYSYFAIFSIKGCTHSKFCIQLAQQVRISRNSFPWVYKYYTSQLRINNL